MKYYRDIFIVAVCCLATACLFRVLPLAFREWALVVAVGCVATCWFGYAGLSILLTPLSALYLTIGILLPRYIEVETLVKIDSFTGLFYRYAFILLVCIALFYLGRLTRFSIEWWRAQKQRPNLPEKRG